MYVASNPKTKKALKELVANGPPQTVFQPGPFGSDEPKDGRCSVEGPHYPEPHRWYAEVTLKDGAIVSVK